MNTMHDRGEGRLTMTPFQLLTYYADTAALESALKESNQTTLPHYLMFMVEDEGFLVRISDVNSVIRDKPVIKPLPFSPEWFKGLSSVRNEIVSVISFARLFSTKNTSDKQKEKHYILLGGAMENFMLEVDKLFGIRALDVESTESDRKFIDGDTTVDGSKWQRINLDTLLAAKLNKKMEF